MHWLWKILVIIGAVWTAAILNNMLGISKIL